MRFVPHIFDKSGNRIDVVIAPMKATDAARTNESPNGKPLGQVNLSHPKRSTNMP